MSEHAQLVEEAREWLGHPMRAYSASTPRIVAGLANAVEQLQSDAKRLRAEVETLQRDYGEQHWQLVLEHVERGEARARVAALEVELAECYRLSGADPDGNEDRHLAPHAVAAVGRLRAEADEADDRIAALEALVRRFVSSGVLDGEELLAALMDLWDDAEALLDETETPS